MASAASAASERRVLAGDDFRVHVVASKEELTVLAKQLKVGKVSNLHQLCEYDGVGADRSGRGKAKGWSQVEDVKWLKRKGSDILLPMYGFTAPELVKRTPELQGMADSSLKKLLNGALKKVGVWSCLNPGKAAPPAFVERLRDGDSLRGHRAAAAEADLPDFDAMYPTMLPTSDTSELQASCDMRFG